MMNTDRTFHGRKDKVMDIVESIREALMKVATNMPNSSKNGVFPLELLFERGIIERPSKLKEIYPACNQAAAGASSESLSLPAPIRIVFDFGSRTTGPVFGFYRVRSEGY